jgi:hypothetical protein
LVNIDCPINSNRVHFDLYNLRINYFPNDRSLVVKNSLHKFYNSSVGDLKTADNYNDFHFTDMLAVADILSEVYFNRSIEELELSTNLEVGVNIEVIGYKPFDIIDRYLSYQVCNSSNSFVTCEPRGDKGKPLMRKCYMSDYQLKFYDKSKQANINHMQILRYEVVFSQLRKIRAVLSKETLTMKTLCEVDTWCCFGDYLLQAYNNIRKLPIIDLQVEIPALNKIHSYCDKHFKEDLIRSMSKSAYNRARIENKAVYENWDRESKLKNKINQLTTIPVS